MKRTDNKGKIYYKNIGGSFRLPNRIIKPKQKFYAFKEEIPTAFKDSIIVLDSTNVVKEKEKDEKVISAKMKYTKKHRGGGWYDIFDENGKQINEKALKKENAEEMLKEL